MLGESPFVFSIILIKPLARRPPTFMRGRKRLLHAGVGKAKSRRVFLPGIPTGVLSPLSPFCLSPLRDAVLKQNGETAPVRLPCGSSRELTFPMFPSPLTAREEAD